VVIQVDDVQALQRELGRKNYPFMNPGIEPRGIGKELVVLDPASNQIRSFEPGRSTD
jgi:hypothetical protein